MKEEKMTLQRALKEHIRGLKELHSVSPQCFPTLTLHAIVAAMLPYVTVFFSAHILSELSLLRREEILWKWVIAGTLCTGAFAVLNAILNQHEEMLYDDLWGRKEILFSKKMFSLDYADMDKQETHDLRTQIKQSENWSAWGLARVPMYYAEALKNIIGVISGIVLAAGLFVSPVPQSAGKLTLLNHPATIALLITVMFLVNFLAGNLTTKAHEYWGSVSDEATEGNRRFSYFGFIGEKEKRSADIRMYNQQKIVSAYWGKDSVYGVNGIFGKMERGPIGIYYGLGVSATALFTGFVYVFTCLKAWAGAFDIGFVTQYVGAVTALSANVFALIELSGRLKTNATYLEKTYKFLDIPNSMYQGSLTTEKRSDRQYEVEFKNVSFKYPGAENWALKNVSMKFKVGSRLAIVGENGSGKTTFIKLLCRLYDPQEGQILLNGIDIRKYNYRDYMDIFSIVFQDFQLLSQPLGANVAGNMEYDKERVTKALIDAGFAERLATMPQGLDTYLYKEFTEDGVEVSGGEAQKIAIARALYKDAPFIILDEPTAALDPIAEAEIYSKFNDISGDKTAIYISHRLSSCKFCDEIAVFHEGAVIQKGSHEMLLSDESGKYHELWHAQAQYYTENGA